MHGHVRRVGDKPAFGIEHGAGEIEPLLDVHAGGGVLQRRAHLLGDRHEEIGEDFERDRIDVRLWRLIAALCGASRASGQRAVIAGQFRAPARLDDDGLVRLDEERGADDVARRRDRSLR